MLTRAHVEPTFHDIMAEQLRHAPWLTLSILIHAVVVLLIMLIPPERLTTGKHFVTVQPEEIEPDIVEPEPPPVETHEIEPDEPVLQEDNLTELSDEVQADEDWQLDDVSFDPVDWNAVPIGLGANPSGLSGRGARKKGLRRRGSDRVEAIDRGLEWLRDHQDADGRWDADGFMKHDQNGEPCDGPGTAVHDVGITGLALLAFLGDGSTLRSGPHKNVVKKAAHWLYRQQDERGLFGTETSHDFIYDHAIATLAIAEAYGLSKSQILRQPAQKGIEFLEKHRNPYMVWRYQPQSFDNDTSITGWCLQAYKTGRDFGLDVNDAALRACATWLDQVTDPATGRCGYTKRGEASSRHVGDHALRFPPERGESLTAVALMSRFFLQQDPRENRTMTRAADAILAAPPVWDQDAGTIDHYYWYYATYALYQMGGPHWRKWQKGLTQSVVHTQRADGNFRGSWDPAGAWGEDGGRVYSTAILVLTLEAYYRYTRVFVR